MSSTPDSIPSVPDQVGKALPGPKVLLMGDSGTGKTHAIQTLIPSGITPMVMFLEQGMETIGPIFDGKKAHYRFIKAHNANWGQLKEIAKAINQMSLKTLSDMQDNNRSKYVGFMEVISACNQFKCDCCNIDHGDVSTWGPDKALCIDGLSGLSDMAMALGIGMKPVRSLPDWGIAQNTIKMLLGPLCSDTRCTLVMIAHVDREKDELTGGTTLMVKTLGAKLAPDIPKMFSDVIMAERSGAKFTWSTATSNSVTKTRNLEIRAGLDPSFVPLIEGWKRKGGKLA